MPMDTAMTFEIRDYLSTITLPKPQCLMIFLEGKQNLVILSGYCSFYTKLWSCYLQEVHEIFWSSKHNAWILLESHIPYSFPHADYNSFWSTQERDGNLVSSQWDVTKSPFLHHNVFWSSQIRKGKSYIPGIVYFPSCGSCGLLILLIYKRKTLYVTSWIRIPIHTKYIKDI